MTRDEFIFQATEVLTDKLGYSLQDAIEKATAIVDCVIDNHTNDRDTVFINNLKICPNCNTGAYLLEHEDGDVTCLNCGTFYMSIETEESERK